MTMTPHSEPKTSQGIFSSQTLRRAECTSRFRRLTQWSRHQCKELTSAECTSAYAARHRSRELTSENSGTSCHSNSADIKEEKLTSWADDAQAISDIEARELTSTRADETQDTTYFDTFTNAMHTTYLNDTHPTHCITLLHSHQLWQVHSECLSHFRLHLHVRPVLLHSFMYKTELYITLEEASNNYTYHITDHYRSFRHRKTTPGHFLLS